METSHVTLLDSNLSKLLYSVQMGRRVNWKIKENVIISLIIKLFVLSLTMTGKVELWAAIASDVGAMILVTLNGMRLLPPKKVDRELMGDISNVSYSSRSSESEMIGESSYKTNSTTSSSTRGMVPCKHKSTECS